ncbi:hypothetical protein [Sinomonas sp.]|uniref:hypothetical protein n=1 Tax=Sinomonas sp. TaxID=1914986 RepID=UPI003F81E3D1
MRLTPTARLRALAVVRHASVAAGLGLGWVLLSGAAASASSGLLGTGDLLGTATSTPVTTVAAPVTGAASNATPGIVAAVPGAQSTGSTLVQSTTTALASTVEAVPSVAGPVLTGPLAPLAPVVNGTTSVVAHTISGVGNTLGGTASTPLPPPPALPAPVSQPAPVPASGDQAAPAPVAVSEATPPSTPAAAADQPAVPASPAATDARPAGDPQAAAPVRAGHVPAWDWSVPGAATAPQDGFHPAADGSPSGSPGEPWSPPLLDQPLWLSAGNAGSFGGWFTSPATLASAFIFVPLLLVSLRNRPVGGLLPPSPAFDPGSTPD